MNTTTIPPVQNVSSSIVLDPSTMKENNNDNCNNEINHPNTIEKKPTSIVLPNKGASYKELKHWNNRTRAFLHQFHASKKDKSANHNSQVNNAIKKKTLLTRMCKFLLCSLSSSSKVKVVKSHNEIPTVKQQNDIHITVRTQGEGKEDGDMDKTKLNLQNLQTLQASGSFRRCVHDMHSFRNKFQLLVSEHTKTVQTIKAMKQIIQNKMNLSPEAQAAHVMKLNAAVAEQERLRLESILEQHILELAQLEDTQRIQELQLADEIERENVAIARETQLVEKIKSSNQRKEASVCASGSMLIEPELELEQDYSANHNKLRNEMLKAHQERRIQIKLKRLQKKWQQQELHRKQAEEMLNNQRKQIELLSEDNDSLLVDRSSFFRPDSKAGENELSISQHTSNSDISATINLNHNRPDCETSIRRINVPDPITNSAVKSRTKSPSGTETSTGKTTNNRMGNVNKFFSSTAPDMSPASSTRLNVGESASHSRLFTLKGDHQSKLLFTPGQGTSKRINVQTVNVREHKNSSAINISPNTGTQDNLTQITYRNSSKPESLSLRKRSEMNLRIILTEPEPLQRANSCS